MRHDVIVAWPARVKLPNRPAVERYRPRQTTTDDSEQNNTGPLGGPVIRALTTMHAYKTFWSNLLEAGYSKLGEIVVNRLWVIRFGVNDGTGKNRGKSRLIESDEYDNIMIRTEMRSGPRRYMRCSSKMNSRLWIEWETVVYFVKLLFFESNEHQFSQLIVRSCHT